MTNVFQNSEKLFAAHALPTIQASAEYEAYDCDLESALLLADRILMACAGDINHNRTHKDVLDLLQQFEKQFTEDASQGDLIQAAAKLLSKVEPWLKSVLWIGCREVWDRRSKEQAEAREQGKAQRFNLFQVILDLGLLTQEQADFQAHDFGKIHDLVRRSVFTAKEDRNPNVHEGSDYPVDVRNRIVEEVLVTFIAPIILHRQELKKTLSSLVVSPVRFVDPQVERVARMVESERQRHLSSFQAREDWLTKLSDQLASDYRNQGGYILLTATEGVGKTALASKLSEKLAHHGGVLGQHTTNVAKHAPWLPGVVLHLGKNSSDPSEIVPFLLEQIRVQLVTKVEPYDDLFSEGSSLNEWLERSIPNAGVPNTVAHLGNETQQGLLRTNPPFQSASTVWESDHANEKPTEVLVAERTRPLINARRFLFDYLEQLVTEKGHATLIIDALEEISADGRSLEFLPEILPSGVGCLLTSRPQTPASEFVIAKLKNVQEIELKMLERAEMPFITGVPDDTDVGRVFNDDVMSASDGHALVVANVGREVDAVADLSEIQVDAIRDRHFQRKVDEWGLRSDQVRLEIMALLAIFEPVAAISLEDIQGFLLSQNIELEARDIRQKLQPVSTQLQGLDIGSMKFTMRPLAEHIRQEHYTKRDLFSRFKRVVDWLLNDEEVDELLFAKLFFYWADSESWIGKQQLSSKHFEYIQSLPIVLHDQGREELLNRIAMQFWKNDKVAHESAIQCLRLAAQSGSTLAMRRFSRLIDDGDEMAIKEEAVDWLREAAKKEDEYAMLMLGERLLEGDGIGHDREAGSNLLEKAANAGNAGAMLILGMRLLDGDVLDKNPSDAEAWLTKSADLGNADAMYVLGTFLIKDEATVEAGVSYLNQAIESGHKPAMMFMSSVYLSRQDREDDDERRPILEYLSNQSPHADHSNKGIQLLDRAADLGSALATIQLARRYFTGDGVPARKELGFSTLERGVSHGITVAKKILGYELLFGIFCPEEFNESRGIALLEEAYSEGDVHAKLMLADYFLDRSKNQERGEMLLREEVEQNSSESATLNLADRLLKGDNVKKDQNEGKHLLEGLANGGSFRAMLRLAEELIAGDLLPKTPEEGVGWYERAISHEDDDKCKAKHLFASLLLDGKHVRQDKKRALELLAESANAGNRVAMRKLGLVHVENGVDAAQKRVGVEELKRAKAMGDVKAGYELGRIYQNGRVVAKNISEALTHFKFAAENNFPYALAHLGKCKLLGLDFGKNVDEGKALLLQVCKTNPGLVTRTGMELYEEKSFKWAAWCFLKSFDHETLSKRPTSSAGNNLVYMMRRGLVPPDIEVPHPFKLLAPEIEADSDYAFVNKSLCLASGFECPKNWQSANEMMQLVSKKENQEDHPDEWWLQLANNDPKHAAEGHLVIGWLVKHGKIVDPDNMPFQSRFELARKGNWDFPDWLFS